MKHKTIITILFVSLFFMYSCEEDFLLREPLDNRVEANFYKTEADAQEALIAVYDVLQWGALQGNHPFETISDIVSDDAYAGGANASDVPFIVKMDQGSMDPATNEIYGLWKKYYTGIYRANLYLEKAEGIEFTSEETKALYEAEVRFLRAYYYFDLVRLFGNVPLILTTLDSDEYNQTQNSAEEVYNQIATDLMASIDVLPQTRTAQNQGRATKWAAEALMVRVFLYHDGYVKPELGAGDLQTADGTVINKTKAQELIDDVILNSGHDLLENYADLFSVENENSIESVFEIQYSEKASWGDWNWRVGSEGNQAVILYGIRDISEATGYATGWSFAPVSSSFVNEFETGDPRLNASVIDLTSFEDNNGDGLPEGQLNGVNAEYRPGFQNTGYFNKKFQPLIANNPEDGSRELNYPNNYPAIRFADVLLMGAELYLDTDLGKAQGYFDRVNKRAWGEDHATPQLSAGETGMDMIYHERRVELGGEGHRYWDLLRRGVSYTEQKIDATNGDFPFTVDFRPITKGLFPIPSQEINVSNNTLSQNDGYN